MTEKEEQEALSILKDIRGDMLEISKKIADVDKRLARVQSDVQLLKFEVSCRNYGGYA